LVTVDAVVENVHFKARWSSPRQIGRRSFLVNASDIAAMGGQPRFCVVSIGVPPRYSARSLLQLEAGIVDAATASGAVVVGGNLSRSEQLFVSVTLIGDAPRRLVTRHGARPGDRVYVTGTLGDAALAVERLSGRAGAKVAPPVLRRLLEPSPRVRAGQILADKGLASAMIDVSDGLVQDLGHLCRASRVRGVIRATDVPVSVAYRRACGTERRLALSGGEDYELLCTVPARHVKHLEDVRRQLACPITCIGEITRGRGVRIVGAQGGVVYESTGGYDHFRTPTT